MGRYLTSIRPQFWAIIIGGLVVAIAVVLFAGGRYLAEQDEKIVSLEQEFIALKEETAALDEKLQYTYTDAYFEREARARLGLIRDDETLYQLSGAGETAP